MADSLLHAELLAACSALGYSDGVKYHKEADCLETTKDLVRYLRRDDDSHEIRRALGETRVLQTDLLPIVRDHSNDSELFDVTVRLLVNLTNPALLLFREELPEEKVTRQQFLQLVSQQQSFKEAFIEEKVWTALVGKLGDLLHLDWENRQEDDKLLLERILILIRNVLSVPASPEDEKRTDDDASVHDQVLWALHLAGFEDLLLYIASSENEQELCMHVLEIISLMLREQDPAQLAQAGLQRSQSEKEKDERELLEIRQREALQKQQQKRKHYGARHSRFGGTYYVQNMKSISERDIIAHQPLTDLKSLNFDRAKKPKKHNKNRMPLRDTDKTRRSTLAIRLFLQEFCVEFLNGAYNSIMYIVKDNLNRARAQENDESYYMWAIKFFMEFNRHHQFKIELVSETLSIQMFHYLQTSLEKYYETMTTDKKKIPLWSKRMHKALRAYQELLMTLAYMDKSANESVRESSKILKSKVFYVIEYREMVLILLQNYDPLKMSPGYLKDVVETAHIFLKLLEGFCGKNKHIIVQKKAAKKHKKKAKPAGAQSNELTEDKLQDLWDELSSELSAVVQGEAGDLPDTVPFDTLSEQSEEEQKEVAMRRINKLLRNKELLEAVSLMRSSREVWPEGDVFGSQDMDPSEEFLSLREIFMANINPVEETPAEVEDEEDEDEEEDEEEETGMMQISEQEFDFQSFVRRFAHTKVIQYYCLLLKQYRTNSAHTNRCILKLFHRIAWDCKLPAIFFQASLFCVFQDAMEELTQSSVETVKEIVKFAKYILRQFYKVYETNPKVFVELLFWKNNKEALEIECGYEETSGKQAAKKAWREEEEDELRRLYEEFSSLPPEERGEKDTLDRIMENLINQEHSRRAVIKKLKELDLIRDVKDLKQRTVKVRAPKTWTEEEEGELKMLFEEYKDSMDIVGMIMNNMVVRRPKHRVVDKILELGLVDDRQALRKKRPKKAKPRVSTKHLGERFVAANQGSDQEDEVESAGSDEDPDSEIDETETIPTASGSSRKPSQVPSNPTPVATPALISRALKTVLEADMNEPVEWLSGILRDVADDREEDGDFEPVPILAMTEACTNALEDDSFQKLLKMIGLQPPKTHQEMFWRVPSRLSVPALRKRAEYLTQGLSGELVDVENADIPLEPSEPMEESSQNTDEKVPQKKKKEKATKTPKQRNKSPKAKTQKRKKSRNPDSENVDPENKENLYHEGHSASPVESRLNEDSSDDDDVPLSSRSSNPSSSFPESESSRKRANSRGESRENRDKPSPQKSASKKRRLVINDEDSDDDLTAQESHDLVLHLDTEPTQMPVTTDRITDSDDEPVPVDDTPRRQKILDDSDDDDDDVPFVGARPRPRAIVESDED